MKTKILNLPLPYYAPEDGGGAGAGAAAEAGGGADKGAAPASPESVLFPKEGEGGKPAADAAKGADDKGDGKPADGKGDGKPAEWKEYVPDPNKSADENARLKAEHDKTKPAETKDNKGADDKVPEDGKYNLTMPEGVEVDQEMLDALGPEFKELGLTNKAAQKLADRFIAVQAKRAEAQAKSWGERVSAWADEAKADKDIGGANWDATVTAARRAVDVYGTPQLREYLNVTGGGNHPEVIRFMAKVGATVTEDSPADGGAGGKGRPADPAHVLFPNDAPKG